MGYVYLIYDEEKDVIYWNIPKKMAHITISRGNCIVLYPENAHRGTSLFCSESKVVKIVGKVKI